MEKEKKKAAKTGFAEKVKDLNTKIESYKGQMTIFESKIEETKKKLKEITNRLEEVDDKLRAIDNPVIKLDSLTDRCKSQRKYVNCASLPNWQILVLFGLMLMIFFFSPLCSYS